MTRGTGRRECPHFHARVFSPYDDMIHDAIKLQTVSCSETGVQPSWPGPWHYFYSVVRIRYSVLVRSTTRYFVHVAYERGTSMARAWHERGNTKILREIRDSRFEISKIPASSFQIPNSAPVLSSCIL